MGFITNRGSDLIRFPLSLARITTSKPYPITSWIGLFIGDISYKKHKGAFIPIEIAPFNKSYKIENDYRSTIPMK